MGVDPVVLWMLLPVVAFGSAYVPEVASFVAGQAMFTMMVLIIFNLIEPRGWQVGLIRVEDVVVGALGRRRGVAAAVAARRDRDGVAGRSTPPRAVVATLPASGGASGSRAAPPRSATTRCSRSATTR